MTAMFYQCGILQDYDVLAIHGYEQFLKALHHHMVMGNVTINQLGQFLILMTYMSFCRINHYTNYMRNEDVINLEIVVWMSIVIMAFRTSFHAEGSHRTINPYFKVLITIIRRRLHVIITRYLEQECVCKNHVQCDLFPNILTSEIILPSYQHFLQCIQEKGISRFSITNESEALSKYGKNYHNDSVSQSQSEWILLSILPSNNHGRGSQVSLWHQLLLCRKRLLYQQITKGNP